MADYTKGDAPVYDGFREGWARQEKEELQARIVELEESIAASQRVERAYAEAIKRHYADMTSQCFICYSCVNHDARGSWDGKGPYACSGCGKGIPKWQFDVDRFSREVTK